MPNTEADSVVVSSPSATKRVHVAVGVIKNNRQQVLIAKRAEGLHQGGLWEFPGGKVEAGENVEQALARELLEEISITVQQATPLIKIQHDYADKSVLLDVWQVEVFQGTPTELQGQPVKWVDVAHLHDYSFPIANKPIITALRLPRVMMITGSYVDEKDFENRLLRALRCGIKVVQLRAHQCDEQEYRLLFNRAKKSCDAYGALLIANTSPNRVQKLSADALHLTSMELMKCTSRPVPKNTLLGASCHSLEEIRQAERIEADYITVGPVFKTQSHINSEPLGLEKFSDLAKATALPVFALGGIKAEMHPEIEKAGAYGIAGIDCYWGNMGAY